MSGRAVAFVSLIILSTVHLGVLLDVSWAGGFLVVIIAAAGIPPRGVMYAPWFGALVGPALG